jgi:hypothetical protein
VKVTIYAYSSSATKREKVASAVAAGLAHHGVAVRIVENPRDASGDIVIAYGWHPEIYRAAGQYVFLDNGYTDRKGYRIAVNDWCPTKSMWRGCPDDRWRALGIVLQPHTPGRHILVAGMSGKAAEMHGYAETEWERSAIKAIAAATSAPIVYRPKPARVSRLEWRGTRPLPGATLSCKGTIEDALAGATALVAHHSNSVIAAVIQGVPIYAKTGIGKLVSSDSIASAVAAPRVLSDEERYAFLADMAYCQWSLEEMSNGTMWDHVKGLLQ